MFIETQYRIKNCTNGKAHTDIHTYANGYCQCCQFRKNSENVKES